MNEPASVTEGSNDAGRSASGPVFISYATADRKEALSVCNAIERRGRTCWISCRDVAPGQNYQEEIVRSLRNARAMVLVFSEAANNSDEIKKELSLASRYHVPVMALRIEDVEPSDAFAYELSTRQWIDAFEGWDKSIDALTQRLQQVSGATAPVAAGSRPAPRRARVSGFPTRTLIVAASVAIVIIASLAAWLLMRPGGSSSEHTMQVRLAGFQRLSPDIPDAMPAALADEINAAFNDDGIVSVSTASAPPPGNTPAYALSGTIRREADKIKVIVRLLNERTNAILWSKSYSYDADLAARVPHLAAVSSSMVIRCGLFGASTYPRPLPDPTLTSYLGFCEADNSSESTKALNFATKVVAAAPDFSWGWSAVSGATGLEWWQHGANADASRKKALAAADRAIDLDPTNSEALMIKALLLDANDFVGREALLKKALEARPLACGCEHHVYAVFLLDVGRVKDGIAEFRRAIDVLPLNPATQFGFGYALLYGGNINAANKAFDDAADLSDDPRARLRMEVQAAPFTHDYAAAEKIVFDPKANATQEFRAAIGGAFRALASNSPVEKAQAVQRIQAMPLQTMDSDLQLNLLGVLGAPRVALQKIDESARKGDQFIFGALFGPNLAGARTDPSFPAVAERVGLMKYWKTTHTKPDVCSARDAPPFCRMI